MTFAGLLNTHFSVIECDLQDRGVDLGDRALMTGRSWRWLRTRIVGLLSTDCRVTRALTPKPDRSEGVA